MHCRTSSERPFCGRAKAVYERYCDGLKDLPVRMNPILPDSEPNYWLSALIIDRDYMCRQVRDDAGALYIGEKGKTCPTEILEAIASVNAEGRPIWKPMHMQPMYRMHEVIGREGTLRCRTNGLYCRRRFGCRCGYFCAWVLSAE